jgi:hypothetical protein
MVRSHRILALAAVALLLVAQVRAEDEAAPAEEGSAGCPFTLSLPWTFENETVVDLSEKVQVEGEDNPLAVSTVCTCPASEEIPTVCTCEGPKSDDCDPYAQILAGFFLFAEKFMVRMPILCRVLVDSLLRSEFMAVWVIGEEKISRSFFPSACHTDSKHQDAMLVQGSLIIGFFTL